MTVNFKSVTKADTHIILLVDRSGSMCSCRQSAEEGINSLINEQKAVEGECKVTIIEFDDKYEVACSRKNILDVKSVTVNPRGSTALYDAICNTILTYKDVRKDNERTIFVITTDGHENSSREHRKEDVKRMIEEMEEKHNWKFVYTGANQDAIAVGGELGIKPMSCSSFEGAKYAQMSGRVSSALTNHRGMSDVKYNSSVKSGEFFKDGN